MKWKAVNTNDVREVYSFSTVSEDVVDAKHWVVNHLDCSESWTVYCDEDEEEEE